MNVQIVNLKLTKRKNKNMTKKKGKKQNSQKENCECEFCGCEEKEKKQKDVKVYFCPKCRSNDVRYIFELRNIFGIIPKMRCKKCGYEGLFPQLVIPKKDLEKLNKKARKKKR